MLPDKPLQKSPRVTGTILVKKSPPAAVTERTLTSQLKHNLIGNHSIGFIFLTKSSV